MADSIPSRLPPGAVDAHAHVMRKDGPLSTLRHSAPARDVSVEEYLGVLDAHGVRYGLLTAPSFYGTDNSVLLDALARAGGRLRGTAIVDPAISQMQLAQLKAQGVCGVRLNWVKRAAVPDIRSAAYQSLLGKLRELEMHVELYLEGSLLPDVLPVLQASGARIVVDHFGSPDPAQGVHGRGFVMLCEAIQAGTTWVKLSAPYRLGEADPRDYVGPLLEGLGRERAIWATDWPWVGFEDAFTYQQCIDWLHAWIPDAAVRQAVAVDTPQALFGFR
ncbi:amidohydrolase family protein [Allopusillimonas soli]|uniref:Amidohydrolase family protein n=1 Tax=Allopusillimonas soli TaxID=659016 RepID=A0A853F6X4_9BURK|nr:amidohydrolase family protein [Allopusillimonas soli]NYT35843.1 amidohydrolase family protein [Allopusillimonas soli]